ncbi:MAG: DUF3047 domain-containing protein [Pseudomonadota bacterium]
MKPVSKTACLLTIMLIASPCSLAADSGRILVGDFGHGRLDDWEEKSFRGNTTYILRTDSTMQVLEARSAASASGLYRKIRIDLAQTPYLNWSWKIGNTLDGVNERSKQGDDYPARIYVVVSGGILFWKTQALNYVWSSTQMPGTDWPNAYTDHARMVAVRGREDEPGSWRTEKRNVREDFKRYFGEDIRYIDAVALMSDTDNSGQAVTAYYGDIYFTEN